MNLVDIETMSKTSILNYCTFVQWVTGSDVVVAQSRDNMAVWYNIDAPERVTMLAIKGDIVDIVREDGKTEVVVAEGQHQLSYQLDEASRPSSNFLPAASRQAAAGLSMRDNGGRRVGPARLAAQQGLVMT